MPSSSQGSRIAEIAFFHVQLQKPSGFCVVGGPQSHFLSVGTNIRCLIAMCVLVMLSIVTPVNAASWDTNATLSVSGMYTDNVRLVPETSGLLTETVSSDFVTSAVPSIYVSAEGARIGFSLDYTLYFFNYKNDDSLDDMNHRLNLRGDVEVIPQHLFFDVEGGITQQLNSTRRTGGVAVPGTLNVVDTYYGRGIGLWTNRFDNVASLELNLEANYVNYDSNGGLLTSSQSDSKGYRTGLSLDSGTRLQKIFWGIGYSDDTVNYENGQQSGSGYGHVLVGYRWSYFRVSLEQGWEYYNTYDWVNSVSDPDSTYIRVNLGWNPSRKLSMTLSANKRDYKDAQRNSGAKEEYFSGDITWNPTVRTSFRAAFGNEFYGNTYGLYANHSTRRSNWFAEYTEQITTFRDLLFSNVAYVCPAGSTSSTDPGCRLELLDNYTLLPGEVTFNAGTGVQGIDGEQFLNKGTKVGYSYQAAKNTINLTLFQSDRTYLTTHRKEKDTGIRGSWTWHAGHFLDITLSGSQIHRLFTSQTKGDFTSGSLRFDRQIGRRSNLSFTITELKNVDDLAVATYNNSRYRIEFSTYLN